MKVDRSLKEYEHAVNWLAVLFDILLLGGYLLDLDPLD